MNTLDNEYKSLILKGLHPTYNEKTITDYMKSFGPVESIRLIRDKNNLSRGFAFVDFVYGKDAREVIRNAVDNAILIDGTRVTVEFSKNESNKQTRIYDQNDWLCTQCRGHNFARRQLCFVCQAPRPPLSDTEQEISGSMQDSTTEPSNVLMCRGLSFNTTEDTLRQIFGQFAPLKDLRLIRDKISLASRGFCFVEYSTVEEATWVLEETTSLQIDGRYVKLCYSRPVGPARTLIQDYYDRTYAWNTPQDNNEILDKINAGQIDFNEFVFDENTGYHFNFPLQLYYHQDRNYYYNATSGSYFVFDGAANKYVLHSSQQQEESNLTKVEPQSNTKKPKNPKISSVPSNIKHKKISKEMEKWSQKNKELKETEEEEVHSENDTRTSIEDDTKNSGIMDAPNILETASGTICLVCKRQFPSSSALEKHVTYSDLHKHNLEMVRHQQQAQSEKQKEKQKHQEKERKYERQPVAPQKSKLESKPLDENSVGNQLLRKMGWKEGQGIGKQGLVNAPIQVEMRSDRHAGLGLSDSFQINSQNAISPNDTYQEAAKKRARQRFELISNDDATKKNKSV